MAMDNFREEIVIKRHNGFANLTYYLAWAMLIMFGVIGIFIIQMVINTIGRGAFPWQMLIIGVIMAGLAVLIWIKKDTLRVEYEYTFTNGVLDISMVLNNSKRRYLTELNLKTVESCGKVTHPSFNRYVNDKNIKKHNWFLNRDNDLVYFFFTKNAVRHLVIIEPSEEMMKLINNPRYLGFGVWQN
ncbi:MAG: hypothetical protein IJC48_04565 [Clostridia bacterium]|nr:hypothetical protein [Clostridia bacterium]